jgi:hypothetical protein
MVVMVVGGIRFVLGLFGGKGRGLGWEWKMEVKEIR